jgi:uncharacterized protein YxeA
MKKTVYIIFLIFFIVIISACNSQNSDFEVKRVENVNVRNSHGSVENVDIRNSHGSIEGIEKMIHFYEDVQKGVPSNLRIVHYTTEGNPIVTDLSYNGENLEVKHDSTRDTYGSGEIITIICGNMVEEVNDTNTTYIAVDCADGFYGMQEILGIDYNMSQQDLFEFELKYGLNEENEINTLTNTVKKENSNMGDLNITTDVKQEVYKKLVYANYLAEKNLTTTCDTDSTTNYYLKVKINGGQREFQWGACDQSSDGMKFTNIANYIIEQSSNEQNEQLTVQGYVLEMVENGILIGEGLTMLDYLLIKEELQQINYEHYIFDFTILEGVDTNVFTLGDKIVATLEGNIIGSKPGRAKVEDIKKIEKWNAN